MNGLKTSDRSRRTALAARGADEKNKLRGERDYYVLQFLQ